MKIKAALMTMTASLVLAGCNRGADSDSAITNNSAAAAATNAAAEAPAAAPTGQNRAATTAAAREPQEILCNQGRCTYLRIDEQEIVREAGGERLLRVISAEGNYQMPEDAVEFPQTSRGLPIIWSPQPTEYYVLCSANRPTLIIRKEAPGRGWEALDLDFVDGVNFASMDFYVHYAAACHPGERVDDGFARRHGFRNIEGGDARDLARPEDVLNRPG